MSMAGELKMTETHESALRERALGSPRNWWQFGLSSLALSIGDAAFNWQKDLHNHSITVSSHDFVWVSIHQMSLQKQDAKFVEYEASKLSISEKARVDAPLVSIGLVTT